MLPRIRFAVKELWRPDHCLFRTFVSVDQPSPTQLGSPQTVPSSPPSFPRPKMPPQPLFTSENSATGKPPMLDIPPESDPLLAYITSLLMSHGKRHAAAGRTSRLLLHIHALSRSPPLPILREAILLAAPSVRVVSNKQGGKIVQKPIPLGEKQRTQYAVKWMLDAASQRKGKKVEERLARVVLDMIKQDPENSVLKRKKAVHQLGMVNRGNAKVRV